MHTGHQVDQGGLAGTVGTDERDDLALLEREAHVVDGVNAAEMLAHPVRHQDCRAHVATFGRRSGLARRAITSR